MALQCLISVAGTETDYSRFLDWKSVKVDEEINLPTKCSFTLKQYGWAFKVPPMHAYVKIWSTRYRRSLFTGFIASQPERRYLTLAQNSLPENAGQLFEYQITCASDEYIMNVKSVPFIPAFVNRTQGDILSSLADILVQVPNASGTEPMFDTTMVGSGDIVPYFTYTPSQSWSEIAKKFGDGSRYRYKVRDKKIWFVPYGDGPLGVEYEEKNKQATFKANALDTAVLQVPLINDVTIVGDTEAGNNREDYFLGDGFTGNFPLRHKVFRGASTVLLQEDWAGQSLNLQQWNVTDPGDNFFFDSGALNVVDTLGTTFALGDSYLAMLNGLELAGGIQLQHGEFTFNDETDGVIGGIYTDDLFTEDSLLGGFNITSPSVTTTASGAVGVNIQPMWLGSVVGGATGTVITESNHNYVLQTLVTAPQYSRYTRVYRTLDGEEFGGVESDRKGSVTFVIQDWDIAAATGVYYMPKVTKVTMDNVDLPAFATYAVVNNRKMNVTVGNTIIAATPLGCVQALEGPSGLASPTGAILPMLPASRGTYSTYHGYVGGVQPWPGQGSGDILPEPLPLGDTAHLESLGSAEKFQGPQAAQVQAKQSSDELSFYVQTIPAAGTPVRFQSWEAQASVSRLQASGSIANEKYIVGDDGVRASIVTDLNPLPRTSEDCDSAALAFLADRARTRYNGSYWVEGMMPFFINASGFAASGNTLSGYMAATGTADKQFWPTPGRFLHINAPRRGIGILTASGSDGTVARELQQIFNKMVSLATLAEPNVPLTADHWNVYLALAAHIVPPDPLLVWPQFMDEELRDLPMTSAQYWYDMGPYLVNNNLVPPPTGSFAIPISGYMAEKLLVTRVGFSVLDAKQDLLQFNLTFGADLQLEKILKHFVDLQPQEVLAAVDKANPPDPRLTQAVGTSSDFLPDLHNVQVDMTNIRTDFITINILDDYLGLVEVRRADINWGRRQPDGRPTADWVGTFQAPTFTLPRESVDQIWYMRPISGGYTAGIAGKLAPFRIKHRWQRPGPAVLSRRSKVIRLYYPLRPLHPVITRVDGVAGIGPSGVTDTIAVQFDYNGDLRNIYGLEVRAQDNATVLYQKPVSDGLYVDLSATPFLFLDQSLIGPTGVLGSSGALNPTLYPYFFNAQWDYSLPYPVSPTGAPSQITIVEKATFGIGIGTPQIPGNDLTNHYLVRKPGFLVDAVVNAKTPPTSDPLYIDILRSRDNGATWVSVFHDTIASTAKLVVPVGGHLQYIQSVFNPSCNTVKKDDWLRIDLMAGSGGEGQDIEVVLRWGAPTGVQ